MPQSSSDQDLRRDMLQHMGIVSYREQETLIDIAKRCSKTAGISMAGGWAVLGSSVPGYGTLAGFLAGWATGTAVCVGINRALRDKLSELASDGLPVSEESRLRR